MGAVDKGFGWEGWLDVLGGLNMLDDVSFTGINIALHFHDLLGHHRSKSRKCKKGISYFYLGTPAGSM